jgi:hypothetical protein
MDRELSSLFGSDESGPNYLVNAGGIRGLAASRRVSEDFSRGLLSIVVKINSIYEEITGKKLTAIYPGIRLIHEYYTSAGSSKAPKEAEAPGRAPASSKRTPVADLKHSLPAIFEFSLMDKEFQNRFLKILNDFKTSKSPLSTEPEGRKLRHQIGQLYWRLYQQAYIRSKTESTVPKPVRLMLDYGYIDETLLLDEQLSELNQIATIRENKPSCPYCMKPDFLSLITRRRRLPASPRWALTYEAHLREEEKHKIQEEPGSEYTDENIKAGHVRDRAPPGQYRGGMLGIDGHRLPILTQHSLRGSLKSSYVSVERWRRRWKSSCISILGFLP